MCCVCIGTSWIDLSSNSPGHIKTKIHTWPMTIWPMWTFDSFLLLLLLLKRVICIVCLACFVYLTKSTQPVVQFVCFHNGNHDLHIWILHMRMLCCSFIWCVFNISYLIEVRITCLSVFFQPALTKRCTKYISRSSATALSSTVILYSTHL